MIKAISIFVLIGLAGALLNSPQAEARLLSHRTGLTNIGEEQRLIRTIIGKGIRFVGEVGEAQKPAAIDEGSRLR